MLSDAMQCSITATVKLCCYDMAAGATAATEPSCYFFDVGSGTTRLDISDLHMEQHPRRCWQAGTYKEHHIDISNGSAVGVVHTFVLKKVIIAPL